MLFDYSGEYFTLRRVPLKTSEHPFHGIYAWNDGGTQMWVHVGCVCVCVTEAQFILQSRNEILKIVMHCKL